MNAPASHPSNEPRRGLPSLENLALKLPNFIDGKPHAVVRPSNAFHWILDESYTSLMQQASCERAWYLRSGLERAIDVHEIAILKNLSTYGGGLGTVVHDGIRRALTARRQLLSADGRSLKESGDFDFESIAQHEMSRFEAMVTDSWRERFPNGRSSRDHPRFVEHVKQKHRIDQANNGAPQTLPQEIPAHGTVDDIKMQVGRALSNWHQLFFLDEDQVFRHDPRGLIPVGGLRAVDPALIIELEEKSVGYLKQDALELLASGGMSVPFYELDVVVDRPPIDGLAEAGIPAKFQFRIRDVLDFVYLTFTPRGEPRLVAMDWKTNSLNEYSGSPNPATREQHLVQLKHHATYLLQRYHDIFERYEREIALAFARSGRAQPPLPRELTADMVYVGDVYLAGEGLKAPYRFSPLCAADLDLDLFVADLRRRLVEKVKRFSSVDPVMTALFKWGPTGVGNERCESCHQAPLCPDVPTHIRDQWPASVDGLLSRLVVPPTQS